jgi:branched-chain amino acid transport system ATP-binding protein
MSAADGAAGAPLLEVRDLRVGYGPVVALDGAHVLVRPGELVAILGPNGAGKTTLLRTISGLVRAQRGTIAVLGRRIERAAAPAIARLGVAHVHEGRRIFPQHTVLENLHLGGFVLRRDRATFTRTLEHVLELFPRLAERRDQPAGTLSGGEAQMLAIARALMLRPRLLMLDEPSLGLAPQVVDTLFDHLRRLHAEEGLTILLVEQVASLALELADRAYVFGEGAAVLEGPAAELRQDPRVQSVYLGSLDAEAVDAAPAG